MSNIFLINKDKKEFMLESKSLKLVMKDNIRYEVHYWDNKNKRGYYIGMLDGCYSLEDATEHIGRLKLNPNITDIRIWKITEMIEKSEEI